MTAVHTRNQPLDQRGGRVVSAMLLLDRDDNPALYMFRERRAELIAGHP